MDIGLPPEAGNVSDAAADRRKVGDLPVGNVGGGTGLLGCELGSRVGDHDGLAQHLGIILELGVAEAGNLHLVRTTGTHTVDVVAAFIVGYGCIAGTGLGVCRYDSGTDHRLTGSICNETVEAGRGELRESSHAHKHCRKSGQQKLD